MGPCTSGRLPPAPACPLLRMPAQRCCCCPVACDRTCCALQVCGAVYAHFRMPPQGIVRLQRRLCVDPVVDMASDAVKLGTSPICMNGPQHHDRSQRAGFLALCWSTGSEDDASLANIQPDHQPEQANLLIGGVWAQHQVHSRMAARAGPAAGSSRQDRRGPVRAPVMDCCCHPG